MLRTYEPKAKEAFAVKEFYFQKEAPKSNDMKIFNPFLQQGKNFFMTLARDLGSLKRGSSNIEYLANRIRN